MLMIRARVVTGPYLVYTHRGRDSMLPGVRIGQGWSQHLLYVISTVLVGLERNVSFDSVARGGWVCLSVLLCRDSLF